MDLSVETEELHGVLFWVVGRVFDVFCAGGPLPHWWCDVNRLGVYEKLFIDLIADFWAEIQKSCLLGLFGAAGLGKAIHNSFRKRQL